MTSKSANSIVNNSVLRDLQRIQTETVSCYHCPRLVDHREEVAIKKKPMYKSWEYWGKPVPSLGDPNARLLIIGLAPAAHGANRTGRMFTGDRSGELLYQTLHKFSFSSLATSVHRNDNLTLHDAYITAAVRCAPPNNRPSPEELHNCSHYLLDELTLLTKVRVVVTLGKVAFDTYLKACVRNQQKSIFPTPKFGHGTSFIQASDVRVIASYHPSQQNTQTGRLTTLMFENIFRTAKELLDNIEE